ncbi:hypothetical protein AVEN_188454-1 [Araneus ventricosus]|uniref:Uncharacterized protein n=1 Tax=Araneus ventricosus TaxID=182803 RepID=A0A4Y2QD56_ARAVE|nr:hypothetical protein AVEN_188454-1 [Araneus ventricosus]
MKPRCEMPRHKEMGDSISVSGSNKTMWRLLDARETRATEEQTRSRISGMVSCLQLVSIRRKLQYKDVKPPNHAPNRAHCCTFPPRLTPQLPLYISLVLTPCWL